jgi:BsuBI/PstI restriction endonuclease domain/BsuBI/PstI restriction endonuclease HTH domain
MRHLIGITPIMECANTHYGMSYAPNTREIFRRQSMHQLVSAGIALYNPDEPSRAVNSPKAVYGISPQALDLLRQFGAPAWPMALQAFLANRPALAARYAAAREQQRVPVALPAGRSLRLTPGRHSELIKAIVDEFAPRFAPDSELVYVGDTGAKWAFFEPTRLDALGVSVDAHGKMPDVVLFDRRRNWLLLIEAVTSHGPVNGKRHAELATLFSASSAGLVFVTAFPDRQAMARYLPEVAWETEVWVADSPSHMIHFNGERFLGPYEGS